MLVSANISLRSLVWRTMLYMCIQNKENSRSVADCQDIEYNNELLTEEKAIGYLIHTSQAYTYVSCIRACVFIHMRMCVYAYVYVHISICVLGWWELHIYFGSDISQLHCSSDILKFSICPDSFEQFVKSNIVDPIWQTFWNEWHHFGILGHHDWHVIITKLDNFGYFSHRVYMSLITIGRIRLKVQFASLL